MRNSHLLFELHFITKLGFPWMWKKLCGKTGVIISRQVRWGKTKGCRYGKEALFKSGIDPGNLIKNVDGTWINVILIRWILTVK